ncbi:Dps family protein [Kordiimonas sp. SCSIO 12610]|uniref:Dps family protein n=1 Tax=Kordiimonas sp. SCSIO 12610 TaxID=2829597 RepID=UPI00210ACEFF|nr:DNA starvation/stationary phase protection protein [Kordiimonas sp. SCSIO 12610]UTW54939.1 DNA starvation/stationary phase protection protein [Kordiimonas sp. SCSIO 12610]
MANQTIFQNAKPEIAEALKPVLADTVLLYTLTQNVHWNVTGPLFQPVHALTEEQYTELAAAIDEIAERIRSLGLKAPATLKAFIELGSIEDGDENASAEDMVRSLVHANEAITNTIRPIISKAAEAGDEVTAGLLTDRLTVHEKAVWMLNAMIGQ